jgi:hypothetical protein
MKTPLDPQRLLEDTLAPDETLRLTSLEATLQAVRERRAARHRQRAALVACALLIAGAGFMYFASRHTADLPFPPMAISPGSGQVGMISTVSLPPEALVITQGGVDTVASVPSASLRITTGDRTLRDLQIDDTSLFTLLAGRPAAIVRPRSGQAELLLFDAGDL